MPKVNAFGELIDDSSTNSIYDIIAQPSYALSQKSDRLAKRTADKAARLNPSAANNFTAAQLQQQLSDAVDAQVYTRDDGSQYTIDYMLDSNGISQGTREVEYADINRYGTPDTRNLYIDDTKEGNYKLGLARSDKGFIGRYTPGSDGYGWTPGDRGVTVDDGALLDIALPKNLADNFEQNVHTNKGQILNRVGGLTEQELLASGLGSGKSEYTTPDAPMWSGKDYKGNLPADTYMPKTLSGFSSEQEAYLNSLKAGGGAPTSDSPGFIENTGRAVASGIVGTASAISSAPKKLYEFLGGDYLEDDSTYSKAVKGTIDWMDKGAKVLDNINQDYIYTDRSNTEALHKDVEKAWDTENYITGIFGALVDNPQGALEMAGESLGMMKGLIAKGITKAPAFMGMAIDNMDQANADFEAINKRPATADEKKLIATLSSIAVAVDTAAGGYVMKAGGMGKLATNVEGLIGAAFDKLPLPVVKELLKPLAKGAQLVGVEAMQEGPLQEGLLKLAAHQDLDFINDPNELKDIYVAAAMGGITAPGMRGLSVVEATGTDLISNGGEYKTALKDKITAIKDGQDSEDEPVEAPKPIGKFTQMVQDVPLDESKAAMESAVNELNSLAQSQGRTFKEVFAELPQEEQDDFTEANRQYKLKANADFGETGNSDRLGATPEEEFAIIKAYADLEDDAKAEKFEANILKAKANEVLNEGDITIQEVMEKAKEVRAATQQLTKLEKTRNSVVTEGLTDQLKGFTQYFKDALANEAGSDARQATVEKLVKFMGSQNSKLENLETGRQVGINEMSDAVTKIVNSQAAKAAGLGTTTMLLAMAHRNGLMATPESKAAMSKILAAKIPDKDLNLDNKKSTYAYASENFNTTNKRFDRKKGTFEYEYKSSLRDILEDEGYTADQFNGKWKDPSSAQTTIDYINREVAAMSKAVNLVAQNTARKTTQEKVPEEPVKEETPVEDTTTPVEEEKAPEASQEELIEKYVKEGISDATNNVPQATAKDKALIIKADYGNEIAIAYTKAYAEGLKSKKAKKAKATKSKPPKEETVPEPEFDTTVEEEIDVAALNEEVRNTSPESQKPTQEAPKESEGKSTKEATKEASKLDTTPFIQSFLDIDVESLSIAELFNVVDKINTKNLKDDVTAAVEVKNTEVQNKLDELLNIGKLTEEEKQALIEEISVLMDQRRVLQAEAEEIDGDISTINTELDKTNEIAKEIYELTVENKELKEQSDSLWETVKAASARTRKLISQYKTLRTTSEYNPAVDINFKELGADSYNKVLVSLQKHIDGLEKGNSAFKEAHIKIAKMFKNIAARVVKAHSIYAEAFGKKSDIDAKYKANKKRLDALYSKAEELASKNWKSRRKELKQNKQELFEKYSEIGALNREIEPLKAKLKGTTEITKVLGTRHAEGKPIKPKDITSDGEVNEATSMNLLEMLKVGNPTSELAARPLTEEDLASIFNIETGELQSLEDTNFLKNIGAKDLAKFPYKMLMRNKDGSINTNVAAAIRIGLEKYVAENVATLDRLSPRELSSMYGVKEEDVFAVLTQKQIEGGIPQYYMSSSIGADIAGMLGIKPIIVKDKDGNITKDTTEFYEKLVATLGQVAVLHGKNIGMLQEVITSEGDGPIAYTYKLNDGSRADLVNYQIGRRDFVNLMAEKFGVDPLSKPEIHITPGDRKAEDIGKRNEPLSKPSTTVANATVKAENTPWSPTTEVVLRLLNMPRESLEKIEGWKDPEEEGLTAEQKISRIGKNRQIQRNIENLEALKDKIDEGVEDVYFRWFVASNSRQFMDAEGGLNPQGIKLHRYVATMADMRGKVGPTKDGMPETIFKLGFAQGLGFPVDKSKVEDSKAFADAILGSKKALEAIDTALQNGTSELKLKIKGKEYEIEVEEVAHAMLSIVEGTKWNASNGEAFDTSMVMEVDGLTNGFAHKVMQFLATSELGDKINEDTVKWLAKVGISFNSKEDASDMVDKIRAGKDGDVAGIVDAYLTLAGELAPVQGKDLDEDIIMSKLNERMDAEEAAIASAKSPEYAAILEEKMEKGRLKRFGTTDRAEIISKAKGMMAVMGELRDADGNLTKEARDLMKPPFMTFGYAAGFESMSNNITAALIDNIMQNVMNNPQDKDANAFLDALGVKGNDKARIRKELVKKPYASIEVNGSNLLQLTRGLMLGVYGDTVADVMTQEFGAVREMNSAILEGTSVIFHMFDQAYKAELKARGITGIPNKKVQAEVLETLKEKKLLPLVRGPVSESYEQGIAMYGTALDTSAPNNYGTPEVDLGKTKVDGKTKHNTRQVIYKRRGYTGPGASGVVALTNIQDSLNTSKSVLRHDVLQVFDAWVIGVMQEAVVSEANQDFMEMNMDTEWSQLGAVSETVNDMLDRLNKEYPGAANAVVEARMKETEEAQGFTPEPEEVADIAARIASINAKSNVLRAELRTKTVLGEQIVLDKDHGFEYNGEKVLDDKLKDDIKKVNPDADVSKVMGKLARVEDIFKCSKD